MIWQGPFKEGIRGSSLSKFEDCPARFLLMIKGHREPKRYDKKIFAGDLWHKGVDGPHRTHKDRMREVFEQTVADNPSKKAEITEMARLIKSFYDVFHGYYRLKDPFATEFNFRVQPFDNVPVLMKGTMDGLTLDGPEAYIREWKCRGLISDHETDRLGFSFQTMIYHVCYRKIHGHKAEGTQYCQIQRPLGNRDAPRFRKTKETKAEFYDRVVEQVKSDPEKYLRITSRPISDEEIDTFENDYLRPALQYLGWWWICLCQNRLDMAFHRRIPWGFYSRLRHWEQDQYDSYYLGGELPHDPSLKSEDI